MAIPRDSIATVTTSAENKQAIDLAGGAIVKKGENVTVVVSNENEQNGDNYVDNYGNIILAKGAKAAEGENNTLNAAVILPDGTIIEGADDTEELKPTYDNAGKTTVIVPAGGKVTDQDGTKEILPAGGSVAMDENNQFVVTKPVAKVGEKTYNTLDEAIAAAQAAQDPADKTVTLIANVKLDKTCDLNNDLTIDLNGHEITGNNVRAVSYTHLTSICCP